MEKIEKISSRKRPGDYLIIGDNYLIIEPEEKKRNKCCVWCKKLG
jgi:hypothetical protein